MAIFEWRTFKFFDLQPDVDKGLLAAAIPESSISSSTNGNNKIIICDSDGIIHVFDRNWGVTSFRAHTGPITFCELGLQNNHLITIGSEDHGFVPVFKVHNLSKPTANRDFPCVRSVKLSLQKPTTLAVSENCKYMAIGFGRGVISLYRGDISRNRSITAQTLSCGTSAIVGISFRQINNTMEMYVCSDSGVFMYLLSDKAKDTPLPLDEEVAPRRCCLLQSPRHGVAGEGHFMVGQDDAVYCYNRDGRGPCYALDGTKSTLQWFRSHLLTVLKPDKSAVSSQKESVLTVIDIKNNVVGLKERIDDVIGIFIEFGTCFVITSNKTVYHLDERDMQSKLEPLFKQNLYDIAVRIAKITRYDEEGQSEIYKKYGDYLLTKHNYAGAVEQYIKTIGFLEPSYVIRKFLDTRHINHLTDYLESLHRRGVATANHTTLLLNCFTRLNRTDKLQDFLQINDQPNGNFDLDVAIKVCRTSDCSIDVALKLAQQHRKHDICLSIMIEDKQQYTEAIQYIARLPFESAEQNLRQYGDILMKHNPEETTALIMKICTNYVPDNVGGSVLVDDVCRYQADRSDPKCFIHLFGQDPDRLISFLEHLIRNIINVPPSIYDTLVELYLGRWQLIADAPSRIMLLLQNNECDLNHAMVLCRMYEFWPGLMYIYEEHKMFHLIIRHHIRQRNYNELISNCKRLNASHPGVWFQALTGLRNDKQCPSSVLPEILQNLAHDKLQSPLQVLDCLTLENGPTLNAVRDYFVQIFARENETIKQEEQDVNSYRTSSIEHKTEIQALSEQPVEFRGTSCQLCQQPLTMPAIYFMCKDSFHQDCLRGFADNETQCPVCSKKPAVLQLMEKLQAQNDSRDQHGRFHDLLDRSTDPFELVAKYMGYGLFNQIVIVKEDEDEDINRNVHEAAAIPHSTPVPFGPGAEAGIRVKESQHMKQEEAIKRAPVPEARMRLQEATVKPTTQNSSSASSFKAPRKQIQTPKVPHPKAYDPAKDPFATDEPTAASVVDPRRKVAEVVASTNPFADDEEEEEDDVREAVDRKVLDKNLNPFE